MRRYSIYLLTLALLPQLANSVERISKSNYPGFGDCFEPLPLAPISSAMVYTLGGGTFGFSAIEQAAIDKAAAAWTSPNARNEGWTHSITVSGTTASPRLGDGISSIYKVDVQNAAPLAAVGVQWKNSPEVVGLMEIELEENIGDCDEFVVVESDLLILDSAPWGDRPTWQEATGSEPAFKDLGIVVAHEMGHAIGFAHENNRPTIMSQTEPNVGRMGQVVSLDEEHTKEMRLEFANGNPSVNIGMSRWIGTPATASDGSLTIQLQEWFGKEQIWIVEAGTIYAMSNLGFDGLSTAQGADGDRVFGGPIHLHNLGTAPELVTVQFWLVDATVATKTSTGHCIDVAPQYDDHFFVGQKTVNLIPDVATLVSTPLSMPQLPDPLDPGYFDNQTGTYFPPPDPTGGVPFGREYFLCAEADPYDAIVESDETDNMIISDTIITVIP